MGSREERILDWSERSKEDSLFGAVIGRSRRLAVEEIDDDYLKVRRVLIGTIVIANRHGRPDGILQNMVSYNHTFQVTLRRAELLGLLTRFFHPF